MNVTDFFIFFVLADLEPIVQCGDRDHRPRDGVNDLSLFPIHKKPSIASNLNKPKNRPRYPHDPAMLNHIINSRLWDIDRWPSF